VFRRRFFTVQSLHGYNSLEMVHRYAQIADIDITQAHHKASPADKWKL
jgi:integrase/recombinase XerD